MPVRPLGREVLFCARGGKSNATKENGKVIRGNLIPRKVHTHRLITPKGKTPAFGKLGGIGAGRKGRGHALSQKRTYSQPKEKNRPSLHET